MKLNNSLELNDLNELKPHTTNYFSHCACHSREHRNHLHPLFVQVKSLVISPTQLFETENQSVLFQMITTTQPTTPVCFSLSAW